MGTRYNHFTLEERCRLAAMIEMGLPVTEIALRLGRHRGTIHRELERNRNVDGYRPDSADRRAWARKLRGSRIERSTRLGNHVRDCLAMGWSPEQIAGLMELDEFFEHSISTDSSTATSSARPFGGTACRNTCLSANPDADGEPGTASANRPSKTASLSRNALPSLRKELSSATGKVTACTSAASATSC